MGGLCRFLAWLLVTFFVIIFWQPITALFKFYRDGVYETSTGNQRVDARIRKRQSDLTASRGELIEVNVESAFEPIIQGYIIFPNIIDIALEVSGDVVLTLDGSVAGLTVQQSNDLGPGSFSDVPSTPGANTLTIDAIDVDPEMDRKDFYRVRN